MTTITDADVRRLAEMTRLPYDPAVAGSIPAILESVAVLDTLPLADLPPTATGGFGTNVVEATDSDVRISPDPAMGGVPVVERGGARLWRAGKIR